MSETEDCFAVYTATEMRKCKAEWQKMCDELKAEVDQLKTLLKQAACSNCDSEDPSIGPCRWCHERNEILNSPDG